MAIAVMIVIILLNFALLLAVMRIGTQEDSTTKSLRKIRRLF